MIQTSAVMTIKIYCTTYFRNALKSASKKHPSLLNSDMKRTIGLSKLDKPPAHVNEISSLSIPWKVYKMRVLCVSDGKKKNYRCIYSKNDSLILFIDIYHKGSQNNHNVSMIRDCLHNIDVKCDSLDGSFYEILNDDCNSIFLK